MESVSHLFTEQKLTNSRCVQDLKINIFKDYIHNHFELTIIDNIHDYFITYGNSPNTGYFTNWKLL